MDEIVSPIDEVLQTPTPPIVSSSCPTPPPPISPPLAHIRNNRSAKRYHKQKKAVIPVKPSVAQAVPEPESVIISEPAIISEPSVTEIKPEPEPTVTEIISEQLAQPTVVNQITTIEQQISSEIPYPTVISEQLTVPVQTQLVVSPPPIITSEVPYPITSPKHKVDEFIEQFVIPILCNSNEVTPRYSFFALVKTVQVLVFDGYAARLYKTIWQNVFRNRRQQVNANRISSIDAICYWLYIRFIEPNQLQTFTQLYQKEISTK